MALASKRTVQILPCARGDLLCLSVLQLHQEETIRLTVLTPQVCSGLRKE